MKRLVLIGFLFIAVAGFSQQTCFSLRYFGLTVHPFGDQTAKLQPFRLDRNAYVVGNFGGFASVDHYFLYDQLAVTVMQGFFTDCSGGPAGFTHLGLRGLLYGKGKHRVLLDIGPMLYYRRDWNRFPEYSDGGFFHRYQSRRAGDIQYKLFWIAGEFAWHWQLSDHCDLNVGFTPGFPVAIAFSAGMTWWPRERFRKKIEQPKVYLRKKSRPRAAEQ